ncbi:hypothetical protein OG948_03280 [Embleya sp. NBC_00888]|uniref:hypothetical protein n=1 Tax=Embleya sp. NBC_00888 TaxID=2975960 RepID=UPI0038663F9A|nr:hypothetical protein OG948_03280 [Embleya sp. NBC_00888]
MRDILADCEGTVVWGADLRPVKVSRFHLTAPPGSTPRRPASPGARTPLTTSRTAHRRPAASPTPHTHPERRARARDLERVQGT